MDCGKNVRPEFVITYLAIVSIRMHLFNWIYYIKSCGSMATDPQPNIKRFSLLFYKSKHPIIPIDQKKNYRWFDYKTSEWLTIVLFVPDVRVFAMQFVWGFDVHTSKQSNETNQKINFRKENWTNAFNCFFEFFGLLLRCAIENNN